MIVMRVWGDGDYAAVHIEQEVGIELAYEMAKAEGGYTEIKDPEDDQWVRAYVQIYEFGKVDPKFLGFLNDHFLDYDTCKHTNFYVMEVSE